MPSSVHPPQAAQNPLIWFVLSLVLDAADITPWTMSCTSKPTTPSERAILRAAYNTGQGSQIIAGVLIRGVELDRAAQMHDGFLARTT
jgi:hypothetical protein